MLTNDEKDLLRKAIAYGAFGSGQLDVTLTMIASMSDDDIRVKLNDYKLTKIAQLTSQLEQANIHVTKFQNELQLFQGE